MRLNVEVKPVVKFEYVNENVREAMFSDHEGFGRERVKTWLSELSAEISDAIEIFLKGKYPAYEGNLYLDGVEVAYPVEFTAEVAES